MHHTFPGNCLIFRTTILYWQAHNLLEGQRDFLGDGTSIIYPEMRDTQ